MHQVLRLMRVFRAVRLFRKLTSLRVLFNALLKSMVPGRQTHCNTLQHAATRCNTATHMANSHRCAC